MDTTKFEIVVGEESVKVRRYEVSEVTVDIVTPPDWLERLGFKRLIRTFRGYGYAQKKNGDWYVVDLREKKVSSKTVNPLDNKVFWLSFIVGENEWGSWVCRTPIEVIKGQEGVKYTVTLPRELAEAVERLKEDYDYETVEELLVALIDEAAFDWWIKIAG